MTVYCTTSPRRGSRKLNLHVLALSLILLIGALLRIAYLIEQSKVPDFRVPLVDAQFHHYWARALATGDWSPPPGFPDPEVWNSAYLRPPGYPYFLAAVFRIFGAGWWAPRVIQSLLGLASAWLVYRVVSGWMSRGAGLLGAAVAATYWGLIYFEAQFLEASLLVFLLTLALYLVCRWTESFRATYGWAAGLAFGAAALTRPNALVLVPVVVLGMWWFEPQAKRWLVWRRGALGVVVATCLAIAPATLRNAIVARDFVLISANAGVNLYIGNHQHANGLFDASLEGLGEFGTCFGYPAIRRKLEAQLGRPMKLSDVSEHFASLAADAVAARPWDSLLGLLARKAALFWSPQEISHNRVVALDRASSSVLSNLPGSFGWLSSSFALGFLLAGWRTIASRRPEARIDPEHVRASRAAVLVVLAALGYFITFLPFFNAALYRAPMIPLLVIVGAYAGHDVLTRWRLRGPARTAGLLVAWGVLYLLAARDFVPYRPDAAEWHFARGWAWEQTGDAQQALHNYEAALSESPSNPLAHRGAARMLAWGSRDREALKHWQAALAVRPNDPAIYNEVGDFYLGRRNVEQAAEHYRQAVSLGAEFAAPYHNLAMIKSRQGNAHAAIEWFHRALIVEPSRAEVHAALGLELLRAGRAAEAVTPLRQAVELAPGVVAAQINLGLALQQTGRLAEAEAWFSAALRWEPENPQVLHNLACCVEEQGRPAEATRLFRAALKIDPRLALTHHRLAKSLMALGSKEAALPHLESACGLDPPVLDSCHDLARIRTAEGKPEEAVAAWERVLQASPEDLDARFELAGVLEGLGRIADAVSQLSAILERQPDHAAAQAARRRLRGDPVKHDE